MTSGQWSSALPSLAQSHRGTPSLQDAWPQRFVVRPQLSGLCLWAGAGWSILPPSCVWGCKQEPGPLERGPDPMQDSSSPTGSGHRGTPSRTPSLGPSGHQPILYICDGVSCGFIFHRENQEKKLRISKVEFPFARRFVLPEAAMNVLGTRARGSAGWEGRRGCLLLSGLPS